MAERPTELFKEVRCWECLACGKALFNRQKMVHHAKKHVETGRATHFAGRNHMSVEYRYALLIAQPINSHRAPSQETPTT